MQVARGPAPMPTLRDVLGLHLSHQVSCGQGNVPHATLTGGSPIPVVPPAGGAGRSSLAVVGHAEIVAASGEGSAATMLKPYQLVGLNWMLLLKRLGVGGCILADEMVRHSVHHCRHTCH